MIHETITDAEAIDLTGGDYTITNPHVIGLLAVSGSGAVELVTGGGTTVTVYCVQGVPLWIDVAQVNAAGSTAFVGAAGDLLGVVAERPGI